MVYIIYYLLNFFVEVICALWEKVCMLFLDIYLILTNTDSDWLHFLLVLLH